MKTESEGERSKAQRRGGGGEKRVTAFFGRSTRLLVDELVLSVLQKKLGAAGALRGELRLVDALGALGALGAPAGLERAKHHAVLRQRKGEHGLVGRKRALLVGGFVLEILEVEHGLVGLGIVRLAHDNVPQLGRPGLEKSRLVVGLLDEIGRRDDGLTSRKYKVELLNNVEVRIAVAVDAVFEEVSGRLVSGRLYEFRGLALHSAHNLT